MIQYKTHKTPEIPKEYLKMLQEMWNDNYLWQQNKFWYSIFYRKVTSKIDKEKKDATKTSEWLEFYEIYKTIKNSWLSNDTLINKYNKLVSEWKHSIVIENLQQYKKYLEVTNKKDYALMASTYINQRRFEDSWNIEIDLSKKFIDDIYKERKLSAEVINNVKTEISSREVKNKPKEITTWVVNNIIDYVLQNERY